MAWHGVSVAVAGNVAVAPRSDATTATTMTIDPRRTAPRSTAGAVAPSGRAVLDLPGVVERVPRGAADGFGRRPARTATRALVGQVAAVSCLDGVEEGGADRVDAGALRRGAAELG